MEQATSGGLTDILKRRHILAAYRDGLSHRTAIAERAGCSRATVYRVESYLTERGLIERTVDGYRITGVGRAMLDQIQQFEDGINGSLQLRPLLSYTNAPVLIQNVHLLTDAELVEDDPKVPYNIEHRIRSVIKETQEQMDGLTRNIGSPTLNELAYEQCRDGAKLNWTFTSEAYDFFRTQYGEMIDAASAHEDVAFYVLDRAPIDLAVFDETLVIFGFDPDRGVLAAAAMTDNPEAVAWGRRVIETYRSRAEQVA